MRGKSAVKVDAGRFLDMGLPEINGFSTKEKRRVLGCILIADTLVHLEYNSSDCVKLQLSNMDLSDRQANGISTFLTKNDAVEVLDMSENSIKDSGFEVLSSALSSNASLTTMLMGGNMPSDRTALALSHSLPLNHTLLSLDISFSQAEQHSTPRIGPRGATALAYALPRSSLTHLALNHHQIKDTGAIALASVFDSGCKLQILELRQNEIGPAGARNLAEAVMVSDGPLRTLNLSENLLTTTCMRRLVKAVEKRFESYHIVTDIVAAQTSASDECTFELRRRIGALGEIVKGEQREQERERDEAEAMEWEEQEQRRVKKAIRKAAMHTRSVRMREQPWKTEKRRRRIAARKLKSDAVEMAPKLQRRRLIAEHRKEQHQLRAQVKYEERKQREEQEAARRRERTRQAKSKRLAREKQQAEKRETEMQEAVDKALQDWDRLIDWRKRGETKAYLPAI